MIDTFLRDNPNYARHYKMRMDYMKRKKPTEYGRLRESFGCLYTCSDEGDCLYRGVVCDWWTRP